MPPDPPEAPSVSSASSPAIDDTDVLARIRRGDESAFRVLVGELHGSLIRLARAFVGNQALAEEVAQETWLAVVRGIDQFEGRSSLKTWIFRILTNRARTRAVREPKAVSFDDAVAEENEPAVDPQRFVGPGVWRERPIEFAGRGAESLLLDREFMEHFRRALETLPANQRVVVTLRDVDGLSSEEVCNVLGIAESNQRVLLHRGRSRLRTAIERYLKSE
jgi:RNA polymerase sigma-70 factor (ECF subfamily)